MPYLNVVRGAFLEQAILASEGSGVMFVACAGLCISLLTSSSGPQTASNTHVEALCMQLKSPYKEVAYAHFCKELSVPEIAQQTGKNPKTIQTQLYRARAMLKKMLERGD